MAAAKVCFWNIQDYGSRGKTAVLKWGPNQEVRNQFIAQFIRTQGIDVLMMMEATPLAKDALKHLVETLNASPSPPRDWAYCYCGSGLAPAAPDPPTTLGHLTFTADTRHEGYAVLWRTNHPDFEVLQGLHEISAGKGWKGNLNPPVGKMPVNLVTRGRDAGNRMINGTEEYGPLGGYTQFQTTPYDGSGGLVDWAGLKFPTVGTSNPDTLKIPETRRPAYVVLNFKTGRAPEYRLCPIAVYHAPSDAEQAQWGALQAGLSRELYVTSSEDNLVPDPVQLVWCENTVLGGDFNYVIGDWPRGRPGEYKYITSDFANGPTGGAECKAAPWGDDKIENYTTVRLCRGYPRAEINSAELSDYLSLAIDCVFYRGSRSHRGERLNLLKIIENDYANYGGVFQKVLAKLNALTLTLNDDQLDPDGRGPRETKTGKWVPIISGGYGSTFLDYEEFKRQLHAKRLTDPRRIAEFVRMFVSDHMPLVVSLNVS